MTNYTIKLLLIVRYKFGYTVPNNDKPSFVNDHASVFHKVKIIDAHATVFHKVPLKLDGLSLLETKGLI